MPSISLCMIVKNEERNLPRCLDSVQDLVDEIVIVDTGSSDATRAAALRYTHRVYDFTWRDDFAAARNFAFDQGTMDYLMWLDADDVLEEADRERFRREKAGLDPAVDVVMMPYHTAFDGTGAPAFTCERERLVRREAGLRWEGEVHEVIAPTGRVAHWTAAVSHRKTGPGDPDRNLRIYEGLLAAGKALSPRARFYYARELSAHGREEEAAAQLELFLSDGRGWVENALQACLDLAGCYERLGREEDAFSALVRGLWYGPPRPEACCELGRFFFRREDWLSAAYWYGRALDAPDWGEPGGFKQPGCRDYIPLLQLCVCHYHLGDRALAAEYNERAGAVQPDSAAVAFNRGFFARV